MIEDCRKMGENALINDKLEKIVLALLESFFFFCCLFLEKITVTVSFVYCTASSQKYGPVCQKVIVDIGQ